MNSKACTLPVNRGENVVELVLAPRAPGNYDLIENMSNVVALYNQIIVLMSESASNGSMCPVQLEALFNRLTPIRDGLADVIGSMAASRMNAAEVGEELELGC